jgi:hypothetical protein
MLCITEETAGARQRSTRKYRKKLNCLGQDTVLYTHTLLITAFKSTE